MIGKKKSFKCKLCNEEVPDPVEHALSHKLTKKEFFILCGAPGNEHKKCAFSYRGTDRKCELYASSDSDSNYCILHDRNKNIKNDKKLFDKVLRVWFEHCLEKKKELHFERITFIGDVLFPKRNLNKKVYFDDCDFQGKTIFEQTVFNNSTSFRRCSFREVHFNSVEFNDQTYFYNSVFYESAKFNKSKFNPIDGYIRFINVDFEKPEQTLFRDSDFTRVLFRDTNISKLNLENVKWPQKKLIFGARNIVADELYYSTKSQYRITDEALEDMNEKEIPKNIRAELEKSKFQEFKDKDDFNKFLDRELKEAISKTTRKKIIKSAQFGPYQKIRTTYQQLKMNYENSRNYKEAGDFYFGEMENDRKSTWYKRYIPFSILNLYKFSSGYGQRYTRAFLILLILIIAFSMLHLFIGLDPTKENTNHPSINYEFSPNLPPANKLLSDFTLATVYCGEVLIREEEPDRLFKPISIEGDAINTVFSILIYIQIVMFTLALRRRFRG